MIIRLFFLIVTVLNVNCVYSQVVDFMFDDNKNVYKDQTDSIYGNYYEYKLYKRDLNEDTVYRILDSNKEILFQQKYNGEYWVVEKFING